MKWDEPARSRSETYNTWHWLSEDQKEKARIGVMELHAMGFSVGEIAERFDLTKPRVRQIIEDFGRGR